MYYETINYFGIKLIHKYNKIMTVSVFKMTK